MIIIFLGPPGSGKGTQAKLVVKKLGLQYFESGDILRAKAAEKSPLGQEIDRIIHQEGGYVSDQVMEEIINGWLAKFGTNEGIVFDGFPRNLSQYQLLEKILSGRKKKIDKVIYLKLSSEETIRRLAARRICSQCDLEYNLITKPPKKDELCDQCQTKLIQRRDDNPQLIKARLETYERLTQPLVDFIRQQGILEEVDGERPIETIHQEILARLEK